MLTSKVLYGIHEHIQEFSHAIGASACLNSEFLSHRPNNLQPRVNSCVQACKQIIAVTGMVSLHTITTIPTSMIKPTVEVASFYQMPSDLMDRPGIMELYR